MSKTSDSLPREAFEQLVTKTVAVILDHYTVPNSDGAEHDQQRAEFVARGYLCDVNAYTQETLEKWMKRNTHWQPKTTRPRGERRLTELSKIIRNRRRN